MLEKFNGFRQRWDKATLSKMAGFWIAISAILLTMILGFTRGGWTTERAANELADKSVTEAVFQRLVPICVAQFDASVDKDEHLVELEAISGSQRTTYVKDNGWATLPGDAEPDNRVASECSRRIMTANQ